MRVKPSYGLFTFLSSVFDIQGSKIRKTKWSFQRLCSLCMAAINGGAGIKRGVGGGGGGGEGRGWGGGGGGVCSKKFVPLGQASLRAA